MEHSQLTTYHSKLTSLWLAVCAGLIVCMIMLGGYTRLSGSGLSITEWKPIHGVIPPLNETEWQEELEKYRQIPQYQLINKGMSLGEFKAIFWPEYWHRILGRIIGLVFALPLTFFWATKRITHKQGFKYLAIFSLGGLQGLMGWYMVASGLTENTHVSHLRLAAHLSLAFTIFGLLVWEIASSPCSRESIQPLTWIPAFAGAVAWFALLSLQILYGAFTAGLHAGLLYNTWPMMNDAWLPALSSAIFTDHTTVQFIHRWLASIVAIGFGFWWFLNRRYVTHQGLTKFAASIAIVIALQFSLGVLTLINAVPLGLGMIHQFTAVLLFMLGVILLNRIR